jgi:hypothetical protein
LFPQVSVGETARNPTNALEWPSPQERILAPEPTLSSLRPAILASAFFASWGCAENLFAERNERNANKAVARLFLPCGKLTFFASLRYLNQ